jgi:hypothetical protein
MNGCRPQGYRNRLIVRQAAFRGTGLPACLAPRAARPELAAGAAPTCDNLVNIMKYAGCSCLPLFCWPRREGRSVHRQPHQGRGVPKLQGDGKRLLPGRRVWAQADRIAGPEGRRRMGRPPHDRMGLANPNLEKWGPFGKGWTCVHFSAQQKEPQFAPLNGFRAALDAGHQRSGFRRARAGRRSRPMRIWRSSKASSRARSCCWRIPRRWFGNRPGPEALHRRRTGGGDAGARSFAALAVCQSDSADPRTAARPAGPAAPVPRRARRARSFAIR